MKDKLFDLEGKVAALTGAGGVLISMMAKELAARARDNNFAVEWNVAECRYKKTVGSSWNSPSSHRNH